MSCIEAKGFRGAGGYVRKRMGGVNTNAHRVAYMEHFGPIPEGKVVMHTCDNPACVNPEHLKVGTQADNIADKVKKGRQAKGTLIGSAKLNEKQVSEIRDLYAKGGETHQSLAKVFGVSRSLITAILNRKWWAHVP
jgi:hypothetical protein